MSPEASQDETSARQETWQRLWSELRFRGPGTLRAVPDRLEDDVIALRDVQRSLAGVESLHAARLLCERLELYRQDAEFMESRGLEQKPGAVEARESLYAYLSSERSWGDFRSFERALSPRYFDPIVERVFARDAVLFLEEFDRRWDDQRRIAELPKFARLAERSIKEWDAPSLKALWTTLYQGVQRGVVAEDVFVRLGRCVAEHQLVTAPELQMMLEGLSQTPLSMDPDTSSWLAQAGKMLATRLGASASESWESAHIDPRVDFGYLAARINQISAESPTPENQGVLVELYRRAAEYAIPPDPNPRYRSWRDESLATIRGNALQSMYARPEAYSRQIMSAAMPLLKESWHGNSGVIFRELIGFGSPAPRQLVLHVLRDLLLADTVAHALWEQCGIRGGSYFREDRRKLVSLFRDALKMEMEKPRERNGLYLGRLFALLGCLYEESRLVVPDALSLLGIRSVSLGRFGFVASLRGHSKDPDPLVRAAARRFLRHWEGYLSSGILRRLRDGESSDRNETLVSRDDKGE